MSEKNFLKRRTIAASPASRSGMYKQLYNTYKDCLTIYDERK